MKIREIKKDTYWKMQNSFQTRKEDFNPYKTYISKLQNLSNKELNDMSISEWDDFGIELNEGYDIAKMSKIRKSKEEDKKQMILRMAYEESLSIDYVPLLPNVVNLISFILCNLEKLSHNQKEEVDLFLMNVFRQIQNNNATPHHFEEVILEKNLILTTEKDGWIISILEKLSFFGYKIIIPNANGIILPFWDWTFDLLFKSLNNILSRQNNDLHSTFIEKIINGLIETWNPDWKKCNIEYKENGIEGEIDFAFLKDEILYIFENKNIQPFDNPTEKNAEKWFSWLEDHIYKGVHQLNQAVKFSSNIFKDLKFKKVIPVLCTTSRNRLEPSSLLFRDLEVDSNIVFLDLDSLLFILNFEYGYELILFYSYFFWKKHRTGIFDFVDLAGILCGEKFDKLEETTDEMLDTNFLIQTMQGFSKMHNLDKEKLLINSWEGDYRKINFHVIYDEMKNKSFLFGERFINNLKKFNNSEIIIILKRIYNGDAYFNKNTREITYKFNKKALKI